MNTAAKGRRSERKTHVFLENMGFLVYSTVRSSHKGNNDFFNLFDHIAVANKEYIDINFTEFYGDPILASHLKGNRMYKGQVMFVQTKSNSCPKSVKEEIRKFPARHKSVFVWQDYKKFPLITLIGGE